MDSSELAPHAEERGSFDHLLEFTFLLQEACLGDDRDGLQRERVSKTEKKLEGDMNKYGERETERERDRERETER